MISTPSLRERSVSGILRRQAKLHRKEFRWCAWPSSTLGCQHWIGTYPWQRSLALTQLKCVRNFEVSTLKARRLPSLQSDTLRERKRFCSLVAPWAPLFSGPVRATTWNARALLSTKTRKRKPRLQLLRSLTKTPGIIALQEVHGNQQLWDEFLYWLSANFFVFVSFSGDIRVGSVALLVPRLGSTRSEDDFLVDILRSYFTLIFDEF